MRCSNEILSEMILDLIYFEKETGFLEAMITEESCEEKSQEVKKF